MVISYLLSKILPLFFLPLGLCLLALVGMLFFQRRSLTILAIFLLWFFSLGIVSQRLWQILEAPWYRKEFLVAMEAEAIVVLSGTLHPAPSKSIITEWKDPDRFLSGINLFRSGKAPRLIFTGGYSPFLPGMPIEGEIFRKEAIAMGVPKSAISITKPVVNTSQEAKAIKELLQGLNISSKRILLVTSAFHMNRAKRVFERNGIEVVPFPVDFKARASWAGPIWKDPSSWLPNSYSFHQSSSALRELLGRILYRIR